MKAKRISKENAINLLNTGKICQVEFIKRSDDTRRVVNCRTGVKSHSKGGKLKYDPSSHQLIIVFDMQERKYLSIPEERILKINGRQVI